MRRVVLSSLLATACGGSERQGQCVLTGEPLGQTELEFARCLAARGFVARDTLNLTPTQDDLDRYYEYFSRLGDFEPVMLSYPQAYRADNMGSPRGLVGGFWPVVHGVQVNA